jgi:hypothetical protein
MYVQVSDVFLEQEWGSSDVVVMDWRMHKGIPYPDTLANTFGFEYFFQNDRYDHPIF